jgi:hypothetical protein
VVSPLRRLAELAPLVRHRRTAAASDTVAIVYNNCATGVLDSPSTDAAWKAVNWLGQAAALATDPRTVELVRENQNGLAEMLKALEQIERRTWELVRYGRPGQARAMLLQVKRALGDAPGTSAIDRMLADLDRQVPATTRSRSAGGWLIRVLTRVLTRLAGGWLIPVLMVIVTFVLAWMLDRCDGTGAAVSQENQPTVTRSAVR